MKKYAYLDKAGIMHVTESAKTAEDYSKKGCIVETEIEAKFGYPIVDGKQVIVYGVDEMKYEATGSVITPIAELEALYKKCLGE